MVNRERQGEDKVEDKVENKVGKTSTNGMAWKLIQPKIDQLRDSKVNSSLMGPGLIYRLKVTFREIKTLSYDFQTFVKRIESLILYLETLIARTETLILHLKTLIVWIKTSNL